MLIPDPSSRHTTEYHKKLEQRALRKTFGSDYPALEWLEQMLDRLNAIPAYDGFEEKDYDDLEKGRRILRQLCLKAGFDPNQPRVPAGNSDGGEWTDAGRGSGAGTPSGGSPYRKPGLGQRIWQETFGSRPAYADEAPRRGLRQPPDPAAGKRARAIYGETSGLTPGLKNPQAGSYNPSNHDPHSAELLAKARAYIGIVSERNPRVHFAEPPRTGNPIEENVWNDSVDAAVDRYNPYDLDPRITNFFLRQEGIGKQKPERWPASLKRHFSLGPFNNVGGGDVPPGPKTYIDFYGADK